MKLSVRIFVIMVLWLNTFGHNLSHPSWNKVRNFSIICYGKVLNIFQINLLNNLVFMNKIKSQTAPTIFQTKFSISPHLTTAYCHLSLPSLNTDFKWEAPQHRRSFLPLLKRWNTTSAMYVSHRIVSWHLLWILKRMFLEPLIRCCFSNNVLASGTW